MDETCASSSGSSSPSAYGVDMDVGVTMEDFEAMKHQKHLRTLRAVSAALRNRKFLERFSKDVVSMIIRYLLPKDMIQPKDDLIEIQDDVPIEVIEIHDD